MMSLNMLIEFGDAFDFTGADFAGWCREVGLPRRRDHAAGRSGERRHRLQVAPSAPEAFAGAWIAIIHRDGVADRTAGDDREPMMRNA